MSVFVAVPFRAFEDDHLTAHDLLTLAAICRYAHYGTGLCYPSAATIAGTARLGRTSVFDSIRNLEKWGYITRRPNRLPEERVRQTANTYQVIYDLTPEQVAKVMDDFSTVRNTDGGIRSTDAPPSATWTETIVTANESSSASSPSSAEREMREGLQPYPVAIAVMHEWAGADRMTFARWAGIRKLGPGGTQESSNVLWEDVATGIVAAVGLLEPGSRLTEHLIAGCVRKASQKRREGPASPRGRPNGGRGGSRPVLSYLDALPPATEES